MRRYPFLVWTAFRKELWLLRSYAFNTVIRIATSLFFFALLYAGVKWAVPAKNIPSIVEVLIVSYWVWIGMIGALEQFTWSITAYANQGTLENLYIPHGDSLVF